MKHDFLLRQHYRPVQPTIKPTVQNVIYREIMPDQSLQHLIFCYWELKTTETLQNPFTYRVVADGCIDIFFQAEQPSESFVMGFCKKYTEFQLDNAFHYVGIRFFPTIFPTLYKVSAHELSNRYEHLDLVSKETSIYIKEQCTGIDDVMGIKDKLDQFFLELTGKTLMSQDKRFQNALHIILKNSGVLTLKSDVNIGLSARQLRRYFSYYVGDTAKTFSQVVRFQNILNAKPSTQSLRQNKIFFDMGYYDQAHFIKEFKNFYGATPSQAFGR